MNNQNIKTTTQQNLINVLKARIEQQKILEDTIQFLLEGEIDTDIISQNNYSTVFQYLDNKQDILFEGIVIEKIAKLSKIPLPSLKQLFKKFKTDRATKIAYKEKKKQETRNINKYKNIFNTFEDIKLPAGFNIGGHYLEYITKDEINIPICKIFTIKNKILSKDKALFEIEKIENGRKTTIIATGRDLIENKRVAALFADTGEIFDTQKASHVTRFISEYIRLNEEKINFKIGRVETGWDQGEFYIPQIDNGCIWIDHSKLLEKRFTQKGTLSNQIEMLQELSNGKVFQLTLAALTSSLYKIIEELKINFTVHVGGITGEGKTFAVKSAICLYGTPDDTIYGTKWKATLTGLETYWEKMKCVPSWCDEMESADRIKDVTQAMYLFADGAGKSRGFSKDGEVLDRELKTFKGVLFSTGEKNIDELIARAGQEGHNMPLGLKRRVLDLKITNLWKGVNKQKVGKLLDRNYGVFAKEWITLISNKKEEFKKVFEEITEKSNTYLDGKENLFYAMLTVLVMLKRHSYITEENYNKQVLFIRETIQEEKEEMNKTKDIGAAFIESFSGFIAQNINSFITAENNGEINTVFGKIDTDKISIIINVVKKFCFENGFVLNQVLDSLKEKKYLITGENRGKQISTKGVKLLGMNTRCYQFTKDSLSPNQENTDNEKLPY